MRLGLPIYEIKISKLIDLETYENLAIKKDFTNLIVSRVGE